MFIIGMIIRLSGSSRSFISPFLKCFTLYFDILNRFCLLIEIFWVVAFLLKETFGLLADI